MADRFNTLKVVCDEGMIQNLDSLTLGEAHMGAAERLVNFEGDINGGYKRIKGYSLYSSSAVPLSGTDTNAVVLGVAVYGSGVVAARGENIFYSSISAGVVQPWVAINSSAYPLSEKYRFTHYQWTTSNMILTNGVSWALRLSGTSLTELSASGAPTNPKYSEEFHNHIFYAGYSSNTRAVKFCVPNTDTDFSASNGAGEIVIGDDVVGLKKYRDELIIFGLHTIHKITGDSIFNFKLENITDNIGCIASDSIQEFNTELIFLAPDGLRTIASTDKIGDTELAVLSKEIQPFTQTVIDAYINSGMFSSVVVRAKSQYRLFVAKAGVAAAATPGIIGSFTKGTPASGIEWGELLGFQSYCAHSQYIGKDEYVIHGDRDGYVYRQENTNSFNGANVTSIYKTPHITFGDPTIRKTLYKLNTYHRMDGLANIAVGTSMDYGDTTRIQPPNFAITSSTFAAIYGVSTVLYGTAIYGVQNSYIGNTNIVSSGYTAQFTFTTTDTNPPYSINAFVIQYGVNGRR